ncbi:uncharacterized protein [Henckelia pumila]|uniref:uncharacterized protein n=1 Tax=Henckelia pumila TaxID=405737 RepID=UPI003C6DC7B8
MGVSIDESLATGANGIYTFRLHWSIYHSIRSLLPNENSRPRYMQMWIVNTDHEIDNRLDENQGLRRELLIKIQNILDLYNPFVHVFRQIGICEDIPTCKLIIKEQKPNQRQYNLPTTSKVAAVIVDNEFSYNLSSHDIIIQGIDVNLMNIQDIVGYYDPLQYPFLLPYGTYGWDTNSRNNDGNVGHRIVLPSTFAESPRDMYQQYQDAMTLRREDKRVISNNNDQVIIDNGWVVSYNPWILLKYDFHINVEVCGGIKCVKYIYKYIHKGPACVALELRNRQNCDEIQHQNKVVGRIYVISPSEGDRFYLRILLNHVKGPSSFEELRKVNGITYTTFKEAAEMRDLLQKDDYIHQCLQAACSSNMSSSLRRLFVSILVFFQPTGVRELWDEFNLYMSKYYGRSISKSSLFITNKLLLEIQRLLHQYKKKLDYFDLPTISTDFLGYSPLPRIIEDELSIEIPE